MQLYQQNFIKFCLGGPNLAVLGDGYQMPLIIISELCSECSFVCILRINPINFRMNLIKIEGFSAITIVPSRVMACQHNKIKNPWILISYFKD